MSDLLKIATSDSCAEITLNRPKCRNALSRALIAELTEALVDAERDERARSVILTGSPPAFSAGLDLREIAQSTADEAEHDASSLLKLFETIDNLSIPVIAAVNGAAVAGGAGLVSVCDIAVCGQSAVIGYPEIKRGLVAAIVMTYLRRLVGERQAKYLLLTGETLNAERIMEFGLANEIVADGELMGCARQYAATFASYPCRALSATKRLWCRTRNMQHADAVREARELNAHMRLTDESREGVSRFLSK